MNDNSLRTAFAELRRDEAERVPPFRAPLIPTSPSGEVAAKRRVRGYAFAAIVLLIAIGVAITPHHTRQQQPSLSAWRAPTDFLLQTPGRELVQSVPDLKGTTQ